MPYYRFDNGLQPLSAPPEDCRAFWRCWSRVSCAALPCPHG